MAALTFRNSAIRPMEGEAVRMRVPEPLCETQPRVFKGPKVALSRRHILRGYYYAKSARGKWMSAERAMCGSRWNWYMCRGRTTPKFKPPETHTSPFSTGLLKTVETKKEKKHIAGRPGTTDDVSLHLPAAPRLRISCKENRDTGTNAATCANGTLSLFSDVTVVPGGVGDARVSSGLKINGSNETGNANATTSPLAAVSVKMEKMPACALPVTQTVRQISQQSDWKISPAKDNTTIFPSRTFQMKVEGAQMPSGNMPVGAMAVSFGTAPVSRGAAAVSLDAVLLSPDAAANEPALRQGAVGAQSVSISGIPLQKEVGYLSSYRKKEFQLKVTNATAEPE